MTILAEKMVLKNTKLIVVQEIGVNSEKRRGNSKCCGAGKVPTPSPWGKGEGKGCRQDRHTNCCLAGLL